MIRQILEIVDVKVLNEATHHVVRAKGNTRSGPYSNPKLVFGTLIPEKEMITELVLEFYADSKNAIFMSIDSIETELKISKKDYPNLKKITVIAEENEKSISI